MPTAPTPLASRRPGISAETSGAISRRDAGDGAALVLAGL